MKFFSKYDLRNKIYTGAGWPVPFKDVGGMIGLLATNDNYIISELQKVIDEHRGGVQEVTAAEFEALKKKENQKPYPTWRELLDRKHLQGMLHHLFDARAAADKELPDAVRNFSLPRNIARPAGVSTFRPKAVAR